MKINLPFKTEPDSPEAADRGYNVSRWHGHEKFDCLYCPYDSLIELEAASHVFQIHVVRERALRGELEASLLRPLEALILDERGKPIESVERLPGGQKR